MFESQSQMIGKFTNSGLSSIGSPYGENNDKHDYLKS
jgi:hypothetical protein